MTLVLSASYEGGCTLSLFVCASARVCVFKRQNNGNRKNAGSNSYFFN